MSYTLYPRLSAKHAASMRAVILGSNGVPSFNRDALEQHYFGADAFPATGGERVTESALIELRESLLQSLKGGTATLPESFSDFDLIVGRSVHSWGRDARGEFGHPEVWDFITLVLLPDLAWIRVLATNPSSTNSSGVARRLRGGDRRHVFQRLWKRWTVFGPEIIESRLLTEDDFVATLERRLTLERPIVARQVATYIKRSGYRGSTRREYARVLMRNLIQISGVVHIGDDDPHHLDTVFEHLDLETTKVIAQQD